MPIEFSFKNDDFEYNITVYDKETEYYEEEDEEPTENTMCDVCGRSFASLGNLKQHKTVKDH